MIPSLTERDYLITFGDVGITAQVRAVSLEIAIVKAEKQLAGRELGSKVSGRPIN